MTVFCYSHFLVSLKRILIKSKDISRYNYLYFKLSIILKASINRDKYFGDGNLNLTEFLPNDSNESQDITPIFNFANSFARLRFLFLWVTSIIDVVSPVSDILKFL